MPRVPVVSIPQVSPQAANVSPQRPIGQLPRISHRPARATAEAFGAGVGRGLQAVGQGSFNLARGLDALQERTDRAELLEANNKADELTRNLLFNPESGYLKLSGRAAVDRQESLLKEYDAGIKAITMGLSGTKQQNRFTQLHAAKDGTFRLDVWKHSMAQADAWEQGEHAALISNDIADAALMYNDPVRLNAHLKTIRDVSIVHAQRMGWGPERTEAFVRDNLSDAHFGIIKRHLNAGDVLEAADHAQRHANSLTANHVVLVDQAVREAAAVVGGQDLANQAIAIAKNRTRVGGNVTLFMPEGAAASLEEAVEWEESQGDPSAESSKGASGPWQVMPGTARWVAQQLGESDLDSLTDDQVKDWLKDPETGNGRRYGKFYLNAMLERYDGDVVLALAAYNAGPGRVDDWIEKFGDPRLGEIDPLEFANRVPFAETNGYIRRVLQRAGGAGPTGDDGIGWYGPALEAISGITDPNVRSVALRQLEARRSAEDKAIKAREAALEGHVEAVIEGGMNPDDLPADVRQQLGVTRMNSLRDAHDKRLDRRTDWELYDSLIRMSPQQLVQQDLFSLYTRLADEQYKEITKRRDEARDLVGGRPAKAYEPFSLTQKRTAIFEQLGLNGSKNAEQRGRLGFAMDQALRDAADQKRDKLTPNEEDAVLQRALTVVDEGGLFSGETLLGEVDDFDDIPDADQEALKDAFPNASEDELLRLYLRVQLSGGAQ